MNRGKWGSLRLRASMICNRGRVRYLGLTVLTMFGLLALPAAAAQAADAVWTGASSSSNWSDSGNWLGGTLPSTTTGTLSFPTLGACSTCYATNNDLSGISADSLVLTNNASQYQIKGNSFMVGSGGITDTGGGNTGDVIQAPVQLTGTSQPWVVGSSSGYNNLTLLGGVSGSGTAVTVGTPHQSELFIDSNMEVGPVVSNGPGFFHIGAAPGKKNPGSVDATDGGSLTINGGTLIPNPGSATGTLLMNSYTTLKLGTFTTNTHATSLHVNGTASLSSTTTTMTFINANGSTPETDFSQLSANGDITLGGSLVLGHGPDNNDNCQTLSPGDVATLVSTTGSGTISGTFNGVPDGAVVSLTPSPCSGGGTQVRIHYTLNNVTATVLGAATPTTTTLASPNPSPASTNQPVTLTATVSTGSVAPSGTVAFSADGITIPGCNAQPVTASGSTGSATCVTSFAASGSPESLTAAFTPTSGSGQTGSSSSAQNLPVDQSTTATILTASSTNPLAGDTVSYTATVTPGIVGANDPTGTVAFVDGGGAISGCAAQPVTPGSPGTATCTVSYPGAGSHTVSAAYSGDGNFSGSSAPATVVRVQGAGSSAPTVTVQGAGKNLPTLAITSSATTISTTRARLNGSLSTGAAAVSWRFQYGRGTAYGRTTAAYTIAAGQHNLLKVSLPIKGLSPDVRYHYRLVVTTAGRTFTGKDVAFTTKPTGQMIGPKTRLAVLGRTILVRQRCRSHVMCRGRITFARSMRTGSAGRLRTLRCASAASRVGAGRSVVRRLTLSATCLHLLRAEPHRRLPVAYTLVSQTGQAGDRRWIMLVLQAPPPAASGKTG